MWVTRREMVEMHCQERDGRDALSEREMVDVGCQERDGIIALPRERW